MPSIDIHRFGPITEGEIELAPLTVLIGPNGSGKSYAAMILHSLSQGDDINRRLSFGMANNFEPGLSENQQEQIQRVAKEIKSQKEANLPKSIFNELLDLYYRLIFEGKLNDNLESVFATDLTDLIKEGHTGIRFDLSSALGETRMTCYGSYDGLQLDYVPEIDGDPVLKQVEVDEWVRLNPYELVNDTDDKLEITIPRTSDERFPFSEPERLLREIFTFLGAQLDLRQNSSSHYLPAGRAGLLQSHEVLTTGAFDRLSRVGIEPIEVPAFSGVVSSYLGEIVSISKDDSGELFQLAQSFEHDTLEGRITVEKDEERPHPKITFKQYDREYPLHLASTSVSELAPLILYTKYILSSDSTVVIEEPEAHLHPENQRKVAYFITRLVESGVRVIVTTHSDFILEQLNNLIRLSQTSKDEREKEGLQDLPSLPPGDVSVNTFRRDGDDGFSIDNIDINGIDGIPLDEFSEVSDELYGESYKVDKILQDKTHGVGK